RATGDERDLTRGRANTLRLAVSGQLGEESVARDAVRDALDLCVSCKGCRRECPTGVDMARMKIEFLAQERRAGRGPGARARAVANLPRYAPWASRLRFLTRLPGAKALGALALGFDSRRALPEFQRSWLARPRTTKEMGGREVVLFADTF